jgi:hypothetical protein
MTTLIEGFFGFVWFGWAQATASPGLRTWLAVAGVAAALVALAGGVQAFRSPAATSVLHDRRARRRYGLAVGVEFALAGVGAAALAVAGQGDFIPVWVCAVVGVHFFPLASLLKDRLLVALGVSVTTVRWWRWSPAWSPASLPARSPASARARCSRGLPWLPWPARARRRPRSSMRPIDRCDLDRGDRRHRQQPAAQPAEVGGQVGSVDRHDMDEHEQLPGADVHRRQLGHPRLLGHGLAQPLTNISPGRLVDQ